MTLFSSPRLRYLAALATLAAATCYSLAGLVQIPAWAFDRGNVRVFTAEWADAGPMVAYGGSSPVFVEYDLELPAGGVYQLEIDYAAATARPVELVLDGKPAGAVWPGG